MPLSAAPRRLALALFAAAGVLTFYYLAHHELLLGLALVVLLPPCWLAARGRTIGIYLLLMLGFPIALAALLTGETWLALPALVPASGGVVLFSLLSRRLWRFDRAAMLLAAAAALVLGIGATWAIAHPRVRELNESYWRWIGAQEARTDRAHGRQKFYTFSCALGGCACGYPAPDAALQRHGIQTECVTSSCGLPRKADIWFGYNAEMKRLIELEKGSGFFERL